jgi:hypothetical protein
VGLDQIVTRKIGDSNGYGTIYLRFHPCRDNARRLDTHKYRDTSRINTIIFGATMAITLIVLTSVAAGLSIISLVKAIKAKKSADQANQKK